MASPFPSLSLPPSFGHFPLFCLQKTTPTATSRIPCNHVSIQCGYLTLKLFSKSVTCLSMCKNTFVYSILSMSCFRKPPTVQRYNSLPTFSKTCSTLSFRKLIICKIKISLDSSLLEACFCSCSFPTLCYI